MNCHYIFFDVANTLLHKPDLFPNINSVLEKYHYHMPLSHLKKVHKLVSEVFVFPDKTSKEFYLAFNTDFLLSLGVLPTPALLDDIFNACTYLGWKPFEDTSILASLKHPLGIISNWDKSLPEKLKTYFDINFERIFTSEIAQLKKPDIRFYERALANLGYAPEQVLYVGDSLKLDILPALKLGIKAVLLDREDAYPYYKGHKINDLSQIKSFI
ncbi:MAG: HAD family hydrolase [Cytophagales bacterium]|nr:MAG: HAD family hydrolase [Cytophagales bacterium]TAF61895.1 MAG: HAD family hydrolase [Cytophagales bacterium]